MLPNKYDPELRPKQAYKLALLGATDEEMADVMDVNVNTIDYWKRRHPAFRAALLEGKKIADANVAEAWYKRAVGYDYPEVVIHVAKGEVIKDVVMRHVPPSYEAAARWLACRDRSNWSPAVAAERGNTTINFNKVDFHGVSTKELETLERLGISIQSKDELRDVG